MPLADNSRRKSVIPFKNYELIMAVVLVAAVIFMVVAFIKISIEHEEDLERKDEDERTR